MSEIIKTSCGEIRGTTCQWEGVSAFKEFVMPQQNVGNILSLLKNGTESMTRQNMEIVVINHVLSTMSRK